MFFILLPLEQRSGPQEIGPENRVLPKTRWWDDLTRKLGPAWSRLGKVRCLWDHFRRVSSAENKFSPHDDGDDDIVTEATGEKLIFKKVCKGIDLSVHGQVLKTSP